MLKYVAIAYSAAILILSFWVSFYPSGPSVTNKVDDLNGSSRLDNYESEERLRGSEVDHPGNELAIPAQKTLFNNYHIFQTFNNCGHAAFSMALSYYGINESQETLGRELRPYQHPKGDNDDKSTTLEELAVKSTDYGLIPYHRPNGTIDLLKVFITNDMPVIVRTWLKENEDIGHYRVIKGYDENKRIIIQDDSLQGKNLVYTYEDLDVLWRKFNYEYLLLVPAEKKDIVDRALGPESDARVSWENAVKNSLMHINEDQSDVYARFNLSVAYTNTGDHVKAIEEFEKVEPFISRRTLWYQIEPLISYYEFQQYDRVFEISDRILESGNRAFSELYIIRGKIHQKQGNNQAAADEFRKSIRYNISLDEPKELLKSLSI